METLGQSLLRPLAEQILGTWIDERRGVPWWRPVQQTDLCVIVRQRVPSAWIVGHVFPGRIRNPVFGAHGPKFYVAT